ncbi:ribulose-phosphate 3-epimerase [Planosporangium flavigriseum]|uniref:Ribulose-phosphate 3-epimerase n=1 Tax=Planosporangium flavigriseum TaxID=373681 RepID=A0A8J3LP91_9ACTN|nr:ribulose-phosphate 3-epimerase [Planosporangium flavigriseum]NJC65548.1 ribulose-phosphate 3-epimerase [Planosporangium flavigriseum]GIG75014.1 ribulose-phosphate 3-epimerase [Planosporangium flavigriseum]
MAEFSASLMCAHLDRLGEEVVALDRAGVDSFHIDVMDGHFVPNLALTTDIVAALRPLTARPLHVHLMVEDPASYVEPMATAGCDVFIFHIEASPYPRRLAGQIAKSGMRAGVAINPATPVAAIESVADLPFVQIMSVEPGFAGQAWIENSPARVRAARDLCGPETTILVDGHIDRTTTPQLAAAGADAFVCGTSSLFNGQHDAEAYADSLAAMHACLDGVTTGQVA